MAMAGVMVPWVSLCTVNMVTGGCVSAPLDNPTEPSRLQLGHLALNISIKAYSRILCSFNIHIIFFGGITINPFLMGHFKVYFTKYLLYAYILENNDCF